jgi:hypothetical protein
VKKKLLISFIKQKTMERIFKIKKQNFIFSNFKSLLIIVFCFCNITVFGQLSALEQEGLDIINPIYAKVVSDTDTVFIFKNQHTKLKPYLDKLELLSIDSIKIDTTIIYEEEYNTRTFSTLPKIDEINYLHVLSSEKTIDDAVEYETITERIVRKKPQILKKGSLGLKYTRDTIMLQTKWAAERIVKIPAQYTYSFDTIWIPEEEQKQEVGRGVFEIADETVEVAIPITRWVIKTPKNHKNDCCHSGVDEECMGLFVIEEIPGKYIRRQIFLLKNPTHGGLFNSRKVKYKVITKKTLKIPASTTVEHFPPVFEAKVVFNILNPRKYSKKELHIQATELIYIFKKK